jgi:hypothetical protein
MDIINSNAISIRELFNEEPTIEIKILVNDLAKFQRSYSIVEGWIENLKQDLDSIYGDYDLLYIIITLSGFIYNKKIESLLPIKGKFNFQYVDSCIRKLLNYARKKYG